VVVNFFWRKYLKYAWNSNLATSGVGVKPHKHGGLGNGGFFFFK